jgi:hypothetical protein
MPSEDQYYAKILLNDNLPVDDSVSGHEIQLIIGSLSKMEKSALVEFALEFTKRMRVSQCWNTVHVVVEPMRISRVATAR